MIDIAEIPITWEIHHLFDSNLEPTIIDGIYRFQFLPDQQPNKLEENPADIHTIENPFPVLQITYIPPKDDPSGNPYHVKIPSYRISSANLIQNDIHITFQSHRNHPITGFPTDLPPVWGKAEIKGTEAQNAEILKILIEILYIANEIPRPECESCQSLLMIQAREPHETSEIIGEDEFICLDCLQGALTFYSSLEKQMVSMEKSGTITGSEMDLLELIEGGISLANNLGNEKLRFEFLLFRAFTLCRLTDPEDLKESTQLLEDIIQFASNWGYVGLEGHAQQLLNNFSTATPKILEEGQAQETNEMLVAEGITLLQQAKELEDLGDYQTAIDNIYEAATPLVENGLWGENELIVAQQEVARLNGLIKGIIPDPIPEEFLEQELAPETSLESELTHEEILEPEQTLEEPPAPEQPISEQIPPEVPVISLKPMKPPQLQKKFKDMIKEEDESLPGEFDLPNSKQENGSQISDADLPSLEITQLKKEDSEEQNKTVPPLTIPLPDDYLKSKEPPQIEPALTEDIPHDDEEATTLGEPVEPIVPTETIQRIPFSDEASPPSHPSEPILSSHSNPQDISSNQVEGLVSQDPLKKLESKVQERVHTGFTAFSKRSFFFGASRNIPKPPDTKSTFAFDLFKSNKDQEIDKIQGMIASYKTDIPTSVKKKLPFPKPIPLPKKLTLKDKTDKAEATDNAISTDKAETADKMDASTVFSKKRQSRRRRTQTNKNRVQICPMCGNIGSKCNCGYMKKK
ncbi:MAG: hypothetical protein ACTSWW_05720 [Promethearchaeota archaeon]